jgi:acid stress-induced BolA-like protein IbaG/YrbA
MKRLLFIAVILLTTVTTQAQISFYGEIWEDRPGGKLLSRNWTSGGNYRQETPRTDGTFGIIIYRADSLKYWMLDPTKKAAMTIPKSQMNVNGVVGMKVEDGHNVTRKLLGMENVEGYECEHYEVTVVTRMANGTEQKHIRHEWIYPPLGSWLRYEDGERMVMRNWAIGPQPASRFEIPRDYTVRANPLTGGGLMEMIRGTEGAQSEIKDADSQVDKIRDIQNDRNRSEQQKTQDLMKMLEGVLGGGKK